MTTRTHLLVTAGSSSLSMNKSNPSTTMPRNKKSDSGGTHSDETFRKKNINSSLSSESFVAASIGDTISTANLLETAHQDFKARVASIKLKNEQSRKTFRERMPTSIFSSNANHIDITDESTMTRKNMNDVTKALVANNAFSKKRIDIHDIIRKKKTSSSVWGASLFCNDDDKPEFPQRQHLCWNAEHLSVLQIEEETSKAQNKSEEDNAWDGIAEVHEESEFIRSELCAGRELQPVSDEKKQKYFGEQAKQHFYETYQHIQQMSNLIVGGLDGVESILEYEEPISLDTWSYCSNVSAQSSAFIAQRQSRKSNRNSSPKKRSIISIESIEKLKSCPIVNFKEKIKNSTKQRSPLKMKNSMFPSIVVPQTNNTSQQSTTIESENDDNCDEDIHSVFNANYGQRSPRATFLIGCLRQNFPPRALVMLRNKLTTKLDLSHLGLGDDLIILLSKAIVDLPALETISLKDNNLTDKGLEIIINSIGELHGIVELNISSNKVGHKAAKALGRFITKSTCPLISLYLSEDCLEDAECSMIVECLKKNRTLQELDISNNQLGKDETLNSLFPSTTTGSQSLANLLRDGGCKLKKLNVHWNMIRMDGAIDLCDSIRSTTTLIHLNLSYNAIGRQASTVLGSSLLENSHLEELILSNNSIDAIGCFTIVVGAREHPALKFIDLDGNPVGEQGGRMLMKLAKYHGYRIRFSAFRCDFSIHSNDVIFKTHEPLGSYQLNLSIPYHRAVACEILDVVALDPTLGFKFFEMKDGGSKTFRPVKFVKYRQSIKPSTDVTAKELQLLKAVAAISNDAELITRVFKDFDKDSSGMLDRSEFRFLLLKLGLDTSEEKVKAIMSTLDADGEDLINYDETKDYIWNVGRAAKAQIKEIETYPMLSSVEANPPRRYNLPTQGEIRLEIQESLYVSEERGCLTKHQCQWIMTAAEHSSNPALLLQYAMDLSTLYLDEAETLYQCLTAYEDVNVTILSKIIPRMATTMDAISLVKIHFGTKTRQNRHLKKALGMAYYPLLGMYTGYYVLDLINQYDRICLHTLLEQSVKNSARRQAAKQGDTSQHGNWSSFRNVRRDGKPMTSLQFEQFSPMPKTGILEFDFVDTNRPNHEVDKPIEDMKLLQVLRSCGLIKTSVQLKWTKNRLKQCHIPQYCIGESRLFNSCWTADAGRMVMTFEYLSRMYKMVDQRYTSYEKSFRKEVYAEKDVESMDDTLDENQVDFCAQDTSSGAKSTSDVIENKVVTFAAGGDSSDNTDYQTNSSPSHKASFLTNSIDFSLPKRLSTQSMIRKHGPLTSNGAIMPGAQPGSNDSNPKKFNRLSLPTISPVAMAESSKFDPAPVSPITTLKTTIRSPRKRASLSDNVDDAFNESFINFVSTSGKLNRHDGIANSKDQAFGVVPFSASRYNINRVASSPITPKINIQSKLETSRFDSLMMDPNAPAEYKSCLILHFLSTHFATRFFTTGQICIILELFSFGMIPKTIFGSYRVELLIFLFGRILDLQNFYHILRVLTSEEHAAIIARLGWLNILNPTKIEGVYRLDLSRWEERQVAKILIHLGVIEPGQNWADESFTFANQIDPMPGWVLTVVWYSEQGLPKQGVLQVRYGDCNKPDLPLRRMLLNQVLVSASDIDQDFQSVCKSSSEGSVVQFEPEVEPPFRQLVKKQLKLDPNSRKLTLSDCMNHLANKTAMTWTYYTSLPGEVGKKLMSPKGSNGKDNKQSKGGKRK